ncbi:hypothetical protein BSZ19_11410 [Bradyrhizobium japonicum]|uniref:Uncharacterized protein n=1 Tax=Bradyrhizobium japonicum TaxID=375 RepID=A0A1Y2JSE2_BRAJP|nr:hypothetical protein BSZ19_11410 [Bradyrhizobium japonicum]
MTTPGLAILNVFCGCTVLGGLGLFVWALIDLGKSALDAMSQYSALGLAKTAAGDPALKISDYDLRSGWKMPVLQAEIFSFERKRESGGISPMNRVASPAFLASVTASWLHSAASRFTTCSRLVWSFSRSCWGASVSRASSASLLAQLFLKAQAGLREERGGEGFSVGRM